MATESEVEAVIVMLQAAYPAYRPANPSAMMDLYIRKLAKMDAGVLRQAADRVIDEGRYFPAIHELVKAGKSFEGQNHVDWMAARRQELEDMFYLQDDFDPVEWEHLAAAMARCGRLFAAEALREKAAKIAMDSCEPVQM